MAHVHFSRDKHSILGGLIGSFNRITGYVKHHHAEEAGHIHVMY